MTNKEYIEEKVKEFRKKFGQFYASQNENGTPRTIDIENGIKVIAKDDGTMLQVVASRDIEKWLTTALAERDKDIVEEKAKIVKSDN